MKILRKISVIAIVFSLLLSGCGSKNKEHKYLDFSNEFFTQYCDLSVSPSDGGYYYAVNGYMYYMDTDKNSIVPVCSKVDCTHNSSTCDAYIGRTGIWFGSIQYYDGSLYVTSDLMNSGDDIGVNVERNLIKMSVDGTRKEKIMKINSDYSGILHRGYVYYLEDVYDSGDSVCTLYQQDLSDLKAAPKELYKTNSKLSIEGVYGDMIYFYISEETDYGYYAVNLTDYKVYKKEFVQDATNFFFGSVVDNKIYYTYKFNDDGDDKRNCQVYMSDLNFENEEKVFELSNPHNRVGYDGKYFYEDNYMDRAVYADKSETRKMIVYDKDFNKVDVVDLGDTGSYLNGYGDDKYLFVRTDDHIFYFQKSQIGTGSIKVEQLI